LFNSSFILLIIFRTDEVVPLPFLNPNCVIPVYLLSLVNCYRSFLIIASSRFFMGPSMVNGRRVSKLGVYFNFLFITISFDILKYSSISPVFRMSLTIFLIFSTKF